MLTRRGVLGVAAGGLWGAAPAEAFVRVSPRDRRYLELSDGRPYIPIGLNMISPPRALVKDEKAGLEGFEGWVKALASEGGNFIRVWLSNPFWEVEHRRSGEYDEERARRIDAIVAMCRRHGVRAKFTLEHFRSINEANPQSWAHRPMHDVANGGPARSMADFLDGAASREQFKRKIAFFARRYGDEPMVFAWELWNEINAVRGGDYLAWTEVMLAELHRAFPRNLAIQSLGSFDRDRSRGPYRRHSTMAGNDLAQVHRYLDLGAELEVCQGPVDVALEDAVRELASWGPERPIVVAEAGAVEPRHTGPFKLYGRDKAGIILHDVLFAPFFAGACGPGHIWHWEEYVAANNLWWHFGRFAEAVRGLDPAGEGFEVKALEHPRLRVRALVGRRETLVWLRDKENDWRSELSEGRAPERLRGVDLDLSPLGRRVASGRARAYDPWTGRWSEERVRGGRATLPEFSRSVVLRVRSGR